MFRRLVTGRDLRLHRRVLRLGLGGEHVDEQGCQRGQPVEEGGWGVGRDQSSEHVDQQWGKGGRTCGQTWAPPHRRAHRAPPVPPPPPVSPPPHTQTHTCGQTWAPPRRRAHRVPAQLPSSSAPPPRKRKPRRRRRLSSTPCRNRPPGRGARGLAGPAESGAQPRQPSGPDGQRGAGGEMRVWRGGGGSGTIRVRSAEPAAVRA